MIYPKTFKAWDVHLWWKRRRLLCKGVQHLKYLLDPTLAQNEAGIWNGLIFKIICTKILMKERAHWNCGAASIWPHFCGKLDRYVLWCPFSSLAKAALCGLPCMVPPQLALLKLFSLLRAERVRKEVKVRRKRDLTIKFPERPGFEVTSFP